MPLPDNTIPMMTGDGPYGSVENGRDVLVYLRSEQIKLPVITLILVGSKKPYRQNSHMSIRGELPKNVKN